MAGEKLRETEWARLICERFKQSWNDDNGQIEFSCGTKLPYRNEIFGYRDDGSTAGSVPTFYQTDLLAAERRPNGTWIPRVVVEGKLQISTHDALTYSAKASTHKQVHPYLRYGILIAGLENVPGRLFRHGAYFDFMVTWKSAHPQDEEWAAMITLIHEEIEASRTIERFISEPGQRVKVVRRPLHLG